MARGRAWRALLIVVGSAVSVALVALAFVRPELRDGALVLVPRFSFEGWLRQLPAHTAWAIPFIVLTSALPALRAPVWRRTLPAPEPSWRARFHALALGGLVHNALPGRLGPVASAWVLARQPRGPGLAAGLSSLLLAKLLELGALFAVTAVLAAVARRSGVISARADTLIVAGLIAIGLFSVALAAAWRLAPAIARRLRARGRVPRVAAALDALAAGLHAAGSPARLAFGWLAGFGPVLAGALAYGLALRHMGVDSYLLAGGALLAALTLAQFTPGLPVGVGVYYFVCASTARALGATPDDAAALAVLTHALTTISHVLVGIASAVWHRDSLGDLFRLRGVLGTVTVPPPAKA